MSPLRITLPWEFVGNPPELDSFMRRSVGGGIYLWIWGTPRRVAYVGQTNDFRQRFKEHFRDTLGGTYTLFDIPPQLDPIAWFRERTQRRALDSLGPTDGVFRARSLKDPKFQFSDIYFNSSRQEAASRYLNNMKFAFAPLDQDSAILKQVETILIGQLRHRYARQMDLPESKFILPGGKSNHTLLGAISKWPTQNFELQHVGQGANELPAEVREVTAWSLASFKEAA